MRFDVVKHVPGSTRTGSKANLVPQQRRFQLRDDRHITPDNAIPHRRRLPSRDIRPATPTAAPHPHDLVVCHERKQQVSHLLSSSSRLFFPTNRPTSRNRGSDHEKETCKLYLTSAETPETTKTQRARASSTWVTAHRALRHLHSPAGLEVLGLRFLLSWQAQGIMTFWYVHRGIWEE